jgi:hypothetical protein
MNVLAKTIGSSVVTTVPQARSGFRIGSANPAKNGRAAVFGEMDGNTANTDRAIDDALGWRTLIQEFK